MYPIDWSDLHLANIAEDTARTPNAITIQFKGLKTLMFHFFCFVIIFCVITSFLHTLCLFKKILTNNFLADHKMYTTTVYFRKNTLISLNGYSLHNWNANLISTEIGIYIKNNNINSCVLYLYVKL